MKKLISILTVLAMASFILVGCLPTANTAPVITTTTLPNAVVGTEYTATVEATDADGDELTFSLVSGPTDMVISEAGVISGWTPTEVGTQAITVAVTDGTDSVSAEFTITIEAAPIVNTAPVITAIEDQTVVLRETFTYPVEATDAEGDTLTYTLTTAPLLMEISAEGVITYTPEFTTQLGPHEVVVQVSDGELSATESFILTVVEPEPPEPLVIDIDIPDAYVHPTKGPIVAADCYNITVTFSDSSITAGQDVLVRWHDVTKTECVGEWVKLTGEDDTVFTGNICFNGECIEDCKDICVEVFVGDLCCGEIVYHETVKVDSTVPCASFTVTIEDCTTDPCAPKPGASLSFTSTCSGVCAEPYDCCGDNCSGVGDWIFVLDETQCAPACDYVDGNDCPISGAFDCGCLLYATETEGSVEHVIEVSIKDNVGNEFTDTWTLTFNTDSLVSFVADGTTPVDKGDGTWTLDYDCTWDDCEECFPVSD